MTQDPRVAAFVEHIVGYTKLQQDVANQCMFDEQKHNRPGQGSQRYCCLAEMPSCENPDAGVALAVHSGPCGVFVIICSRV